MSNYLDGMKIVSEDVLTVGKDSKIYLVLYHEREVVAKVFKKSKSDKKIENEFYFLEKSYKLGVGPKPYKYVCNSQNKYILMERLDKTIYDCMKKTKGKLTLKQQKEIIEILKILDRYDIFHGDVSPSNFMYDYNKSLVAIDYGMSKKIDDKFLKKFGKKPNIKLGLTFFILRSREVYPEFKPELLLKEIEKNMDLKTE